MASRPIHRLSARTVATLKTPGLHADGAGLYLVVDTSGRKRWTYLFQWEGRRREMGLGSTTDVGLAEARELAAAARRKVRSGDDPIAQRKRAAPRVKTFGEVASELMIELEAGWKHPAHRQQWKLHLTGYAAPIRETPVDQVSTDDVLAILQPIWSTKAETASRVRARIERVLDAAKARGLRSGENPARLRGHLALLLPEQRRLARGHHAALPYEEAPSFLERLRASRGMGARALEFVLFTLARESEALKASWDEINLGSGLWVIPSHRMKAGKEHRVPLCAGALTLLSTMQEEVGNDGLIFPGRTGRPLSNATMDAVFDRLGVRATPHGLRSTFRDWAGDCTAFPREVAEAALAHRTGDAVELAYRRGDALAKRREMMEAWGTYCCSSQVVTRDAHEHGPTPTEGDA